MSKTKISGDLLGDLSEGVLLNESAASVVAATQGTIFVSDGSASLVQNKLHYKDGGGLVTRIDLPTMDRHLFSMPVTPGTTVSRKGWANGNARLVKAKFYHSTGNTGGGVYTLGIMNLATGNTVLSTETIDLNGVTANTVSPMTLTPTALDLAFTENDKWEVSIVMAGTVNSSGIYLDLVFGSDS